MMLTLSQRAVMMKHKMNEQEMITKNKKSLTNLAHAYDRYIVTIWCFCDLSNHRIFRPMVVNMSPTVGV